MYLTRRDPIYDAFNEMFRSPFFSGANDTQGSTGKLMKTNIQELEGGYVLDMGETVMNGRSSELVNDPKVISAYLGGE